MQITALTFDDFETLDLFGAVEVFGRVTDYDIQYASMTGGIISNQHGVRLETIAVADLPKNTDILLVIGGQGTRRLVDDTKFLQTLTNLANQATWVLSVCTGSALLAKTGLLDGKRATSNKKSWKWVISQSDKVQWIEQARWVVDEKFYTSSGISAGTDMSLGFIADRYDTETAQTIANEIEYRWAKNPDNDEFFLLWQHS